MMNNSIRTRERFIFDLVDSMLNYLSVSAGNAIYPAESADRMKSNTAASPGIRMQFRSPPPSRNMVSENPLDVSQFVFEVETSATFSFIINIYFFNNFWC